MVDERLFVVSRIRQVFLAILVILAGQALAADASSVTVAWRPNPERDVVGYELRYGTTPGWHPSKVKTVATRATIGGLRRGTTYYFVVLARDRAGNSSQLSKQLTYRVKNTSAASPQGRISSPKGVTTILAGETVSFSGKGSDPKGNALRFSWKFGGGSGIDDSSSKNPGIRQFNIPGTYTVTLSVTNSLGIVDPTPAKRTIVVKEPTALPLSRQGWKLKWVNSEDAANYPARFAFDDDPTTFWHTEWGKPGLPPPPHELQIDLGKAATLNGFQYLPRQDGFSVGNVGSYRFYVSKDGKKWGKPVASGTFHNTPDAKKVFFGKKKGRYVKLISMSEVSGYKDCNVAELHVLQAKVSKKKKKKNAAKLSASVLAKAIAPVSYRAVTSGVPAKVVALFFPEKTSRETIRVIAGEKYRALTIGTDSGKTGRFTVEVSGDLQEWFSGPSHTTAFRNSNESVTVRDNVPFSNTRKRYIRVRPQPR